MADQRLYDRQSFMVSTASRYYYFIFLHNCVISKEVHAPPWLTIINKIIPKQEKKNLFSPQSLQERGKSNNTGQRYGLRWVQEVLSRPCRSAVGFPGDFGESKGKAIWMVMRQARLADSAGRRTACTPSSKEPLFFKFLKLESTTY